MSNIGLMNSYSIPGYDNGVYIGRLCQVMHLDPKKVILTLVMFSNIGGASNGIGDPPNVLIINSPDIKKVSIVLNYFLS